VDFFLLLSLMDFTPFEEESEFVNVDLSGKRKPHSKLAFASIELER